ncbi:MAG: prohibitin family protein [Bacteroidia bacterium]|nr:prohibitin family protein [Bacteroidia bacterium]
MKSIASIFLASILLCCASSCTVIRPGEVGIKQRLGRLSPNTHLSGRVWFNPFNSRVIKTSIQTSNLELNLNLPTKEGVSVSAHISILYRLNTDSVKSVIKHIGLNYETIIANVFKSASADVCSKYLAKDLHSGMRSEIEKGILAKMSEILTQRGIITEAVLMKSIQLPAGLSSSIEQKLQAEQDVMRMEFLIKQTKLEAERKVIEAKGQSDAQKILSEGLTEQIIKLRSIEAFKDLSNSNNAKVIITDGKTPFLIGQDNTEIKK